MSALVAVYPGTFDPLTLGHEDIIARACVLFDEVVVAVARAHHKKTLFSLEERLSLVQEVFAQQPQVRVLPFEGLVTHFLAEQQARVMVRGLRGLGDFDGEMQLAGMNRQLAADIDTVFLPSSGLHQSISSTLVREIASLGGAYEPFVSAPIARALKRRLAI